ncbi:MAG: hypothetical protein HYS20_05130 [Rhodocyclales bacterium]|nr:hypothetical protein [Rhodocyclales bacterium]
MRRQRLLACCAVPLLGGCTALPDAINAEWTNAQLQEFGMVAVAAYVLYDPFAPTWKIEVAHLDEERVRLDLRMRVLATGGEGESRRVFMRNAREIAEKGGFAGFDVIRYEEGVESSRPFAQRFASGEIRLARSRAWPAL